MISNYTFLMIKVFGSYFTYLDKINTTVVLVNAILWLYLNNFMENSLTINLNIYIYI